MGKFSSLKAGRKNVSLLMTTQAFFIGANMTVVAFAGLAGSVLAETPLLATLPVAAALLSTALMTAPMSLLMARIGRRAGFHLGGLFCTLGGLLAASAIYLASFWLLVFAMAILGVFLASGQYYRFAASESVSSEAAPRAISLVLVGGLVAALLMPTLARFSNDLFLPYSFMGIYIMVAVFGLLLQIPVSFMKLSRPAKEAASGGDARPLSAIVWQAGFFTAVINAAFGYAMMSFIMTATPLAMQACGFDAVTGAEVIQGHVVAMYLPSLFTGLLIQRFGVVPVLLMGHTAFTLAFIIAIDGIGLGNFSVALIFLGIGWNFCFIGGTTLLTRLHRPSERGRVQALSETCVFGSAATASLASGAVLRYFGWTQMNEVSFVLLVTAATVTVIYGVRQYLRGKKAVLT